jgi:uncharacterized integral membrane protein
MDVGGRRLDLGAMIFGAILLVVGVWYLLRNTLGFEMPEIDWDMVWPLVVIAIGASVVVRAMRRSGATKD